MIIKSIMNLRSRILLCVLLPAFVGLSTVKAQQIDSLKIDLSRALEIALSENPTIKVADMEITKKQYAKKSAYGALMPPDGPDWSIPTSHQTADGLF